MERLAESWDVHFPKHMKPLLTLGTKEVNPFFYKQGGSSILGRECAPNLFVIPASGNKVSEKAHFWSPLSPFVYLVLYATL